MSTYVEIQIEEMKTMVGKFERAFAIKIETLNFWKKLLFKQYQGQHLYSSGLFESLQTDQS